MANPILFEVASIGRGDSASIGLYYDPLCFQGLDPLTARLVSHFKLQPDQGDPTAILDSAITPGSFLRNIVASNGNGFLAGDVHLTLSLTSLQTALFTRHSVLFDILAIAGATTVRLPISWQWPVESGITFNV